MSETGWQPIATAPKDGTEVLLWDGAKVFLGYKGSGWRDVITPAEDFTTYETPTHWQPLPPPPSGDE